ncbi:6401_t:CDS:1 [Funneliformis caledonium]|uniref:6401_t:CDS:1 n=1 Tax=Funneliformis caledonium TaxID=1117310 RepID=A0A9N9H4B4_9GLOM|nr:6401_t:CDS:1 [Funneliformis caledonium]
MSFYCFETRQDRTLAPYPPPEFSQQLEKMSPAEIVDHIINTNIDPHTLLKIEKSIAVPLRQLISPRENRRRRCIPRPQNNFVLYRRNFHAVITKERGHGVAKDFKLISNEAARHWSEESNETKQLYELIADCAKKVHDCTYPQYVYQPKHKSNKKGANNTIFREVTVDSCSKKNNDKNKDGKDSKVKSDPKKDRITMTKSFVSSNIIATTTFLSADVDVPFGASITNINSFNKAGSGSDIPQSNSEENKKEWRWAHYSQNEATINTINNVRNVTIATGTKPTKTPPPASAPVSPRLPGSAHSTVSTNSPASPHTPVSSLPPVTIRPPLPSVNAFPTLPTIDAQISTNFTSYDKNVWNLVNGFTNL